MAVHWFSDNLRLVCVFVRKLEAVQVGSYMRRLEVVHKQFEGYIRKLEVVHK